MRSLTIEANDGSKLRFEVPNGVRVYKSIKALRALNSGRDYANITEAEAAFVADVVAAIQEYNAAQTLPAAAESKES